MRRLLPPPPHEEGLELVRVELGEGALGGLRHLRQPRVAQAVRGAQTLALVLHQQTTDEVLQRGRTNTAVIVVYLGGSNYCGSTTRRDF